MAQPANKPMPYTPWERGVTREDGEIYTFPDGTDYLCWFDVEMHYVNNKRLTNAECAAEMWKAHHYAAALAYDDYWPGPEYVKAETWWKFATTPHASEARYE